MKLSTYDISGKSVGKIDVDDTIWDARMNEALLHQVVVGMAANLRQGNHSSQNRSDVKYSTRKLRRQKQGGVARLGSRSSPSMVGGGAAHGPHPRSYRQKLQKKMRRQALFMSLSQKNRENRLKVVDKFEFDNAKTADMRRALESLDIQRSTLIVTGAVDQDIIRVSSNLANVKVTHADIINPLAMIKVQNVILTAEAVRRIENIWSASGETAKSASKSAANPSKSESKSAKSESKAEKPATKAETKVETAASEPASKPAKKPAAKATAKPATKAASKKTTAKTATKSAAKKSATKSSKKS